MIHTHTSYVSVLGQEAHTESVRESQSQALIMSPCGVTATFVLPVRDSWSPTTTSLV